MKWLVLAALLFAIVSTLGAIQLLTFGVRKYHPIEELVGNGLFSLLAAGIPVAIGLGIVRYRLYDIDVLISKTIVYLGLSAFVGVTYVVSVVLVGELVDRWSGSSTLLATAVVAAAFHPLRTAMQSGADRLVFGDRAAPYELMTQFGHELGQTLGHPDVLARIAETAARATRADLARVTATLPDGETLTETWPAHAPSPASFDIVMPVHHESTVIAEIAVVGATARTEGVVLLRHVAAVSSAALRNLRLLAELDSLHETILRQNAEITASKKRLITAAEVERRQLAQFVTQRLRPHLALLEDTLPTLRREVYEQPDTMVTECERLTARATRMVDEMRALSRGLLPPLLVDHGLAAALRALLRRLDLEVTLDMPSAIAESRFPAPIESTVYLCCQAVLTAAATGSGGTSATLRIWRDDGCLAFSVTHNARQGGSDDPTAIRDRITTLGGELVTRLQGQWSTVTGTLPLSGGLQ